MRILSPATQCKAMRTFFFTPIAVLILAVVAASCGGGAADPVVEDTPNSSNEVVVDGVETAERSENGGDRNEVDDVIVPPTLKPGSAPVLGELESEIQAVSDECSDALAPIRAL